MSTPENNVSNPIFKFFANSREREKYLSLFWLVDKKVYACGDNSHGQLGLGNEINQATPQEITFFKDKNIQVNQIVNNGNNGTFFLTDKGGVYACGDNSHGQLGLGNEIDQATPQEITFFKTNNIEVNRIVDNGDYGTFFLTDSGVYVCGDAGSHQLGGWSMRDQLLPQQIHYFKDKDIQFEQIVTDRKNTFFLTDKEFYVCGGNIYGSLGVGNERSQYLQENLFFKTNNIKVNQIVSNNYSTFFLTGSGVYACGNNDYARLGFGDRTNRYLPEKIPFKDENIRVNQIISEKELTFFITDMGWVYVCWHSMDEVLTKKHDQLIPQEITFFRNNNIKVNQIVSLSYSNSSFFLTDRGVYVCGNNSHGQLGLGNKEYQETPQENTFFKNKNIKQIIIGYKVTLFVDENDEFYFCGKDKYGFLGERDKIIETPTIIRNFSPLILKYSPYYERFNIFSNLINMILVEKLLNKEISKKDRDLLTKDKDMQKEKTSVLSFLGKDHALLLEKSEDIRKERTRALSFFFLTGELPDSFWRFAAECLYGEIDEKTGMPATSFKEKKEKEKGGEVRVPVEVKFFQDKEQDRESLKKLISNFVRFNPALLGKRTCLDFIGSIKSKLLFAPFLDEMKNIAAMEGEIGKYIKELLSTNEPIELSEILKDRKKILDMIVEGNKIIGKKNEEIEKDNQEIKKKNREIEEKNFAMMREAYETKKTFLEENKLPELPYKEELPEIIIDLNEKEINELEGRIGDLYSILEDEIFPLYDIVQNLPPELLLPDFYQDLRIDPYQAKGLQSIEITSLVTNAFLECLQKLSGYKDKDTATTIDTFIKNITKLVTDKFDDKHYLNSIKMVYSVIEFMAPISKEIAEIFAKIKIEGLIEYLKENTIDFEPVEFDKKFQTQRDRVKEIVAEKGKRVSKQPWAQKIIGKKTEKKEVSPRI